jgi:Uma2 family endonuclease
MTVATHKTSTNRPMTLEEFLAYEDGTDTRYELVAGVLVEMGAENPLNVNIAVFLLTYFLQAMGIPFYRLAIGHQIGVSETTATARQPDLIVHTEDSAAATLTDQILLFHQPNPMLIVEVVSSSGTDKQSRDRDYVDKRAEYQARGVPEYWIVDPLKAVIIVLYLQEGRYVGQTFTGQQTIVSPTFPHLNLTAETVLKAGR